MWIYPGFWPSTMTHAPLHFPSAPVCKDALNLWSGKCQGSQWKWERSFMRSALVTCFKLLWQNNLAKAKEYVSCFAFEGAKAKKCVHWLTLGGPVLRGGKGVAVGVWGIHSQEAESDKCWHPNQLHFFLCVETPSLCNSCPYLMCALRSQIK